MLYLGIFLVVYGVFCIIVGITKLPAIWNMGKIQIFVKFLGDLGTRIFILVWGLIATGFGIYFLMK